MEGEGDSVVKEKHTQGVFYFTSTWAREKVVKQSREPKNLNFLSNQGDNAGTELSNRSEERNCVMKQKALMEPCVAIYWVVDCEGKLKKDV
jgi:hypothetical protein